jgi:toxin HigB-1
MLVITIESFNHKGLKRLYQKDDARFIQPDLVETVREILTLLDAAATPKALDLPGYRLHALKGELKGYWSVTVRANWRIVFCFRDGGAHDVELMDYH